MKSTPISFDLLSHADDLKVKKDNDQLFVWDPSRKKYVRLEPEEMVRQLLMRHIHLALKVGYGRMVSEKQIPNYQRSRFDLGVMKPKGGWSLLAECKSYKVNIDQNTLVQIAKYNAEIQADYLMVSNGHQTYVWKAGPTPQFITDESQLLYKI